MFLYTVPLTLIFFFYVTEMKNQDTDTEESATQSSEEAPPAAGGAESCAAAKDSLDSNSPKESEPQTPQTDTPPQSDEAGSEGITGIIYNVIGIQMVYVSWYLFYCNLL